MPLCRPKEEYIAPTHACTHATHSSDCSSTGKPKDGQPAPPLSFVRRDRSFPRPPRSHSASPSVPRSPEKKKQTFQHCHFSIAVSALSGAESRRRKAVQGQRRGKTYKKNIVIFTGNTRRKVATAAALLCIVHTLLRVQSQSHPNS